MAEKMIKCKFCGNEIASSAKTCPSCGAKNKKSILKKWWFWLAIVLVVIVVASASGGSDTPEITSAGEVASSEQVDVVTEESDVKKTTSSISLGKLNALGSAKAYLRTMAFSYDGLINQLEFEGYTAEEAKYAADNCEADWNEQAAKKAEDYLDTMSFSREGLIDQLEFEGFTYEQAVYGVEAVGY